MRTKDKGLMREIKHCIEEYYGQYGEAPTIRHIATVTDSTKSTVQRYIDYMISEGMIEMGEGGYETKVTRSTDAMMVAIPKLGYVPCGPLSEEYECIDGYVRLPASFVGGASKCFLLTASGNSMVDAGIEDGDLLLIAQQNTADYNDIVVALVDNEVTLKRYRPDPENRRVILHPENKRMKDIIVKDCQIQGVAIKVIKSLKG